MSFRYTTSAKSRSTQRSETNAETPAAGRKPVKRHCSLPTYIFALDKMHFRSEHVGKVWQIFDDICQHLPNAGRLILGSTEADFLE